MRAFWVVTACCFVALFGSAAPAYATPDLASLTLDPSAVVSGGSSTGTVTLTEPAVTDTQVTLSATPANGATVPASVTVSMGQTQATFPVTDAGTSNQTTITASLGATMVAQELTVVSAFPRLVVNEVDYEQPGTNDHEFVEIYNGGSNADLTNDALVLVNGGTSDEYARVSLAPVGCLISGGYLVVADPAVTPAAGALVIRFAGASSIQNGDPDGVALINTSDHTLLDALSYGGQINQANITGFPNAVNLVEGGTPTSATDSAAVSRSLIRSPNGQDTDNANTDWATTSLPTPGAPNDGSGGVVPGACPNHAPALTAIGNRSVAAGSTLAFTVSGTDADGDSLTFSASNLPAGATFDPASRAFSWTPSAVQTGSYPNVHFTVSDGKATAAEDIAITVSAPTLTGGDTNQGSNPSPGPSPDPGAPAGPTPESGQPQPPASPAPVGTATAPQTTRLKVKVRKHTATATFKGTGKSFQCKLDKGRFKTCRAPASFKRLKPGKHTLRVRAKNSAGTVDPTPATKKFVVKR